MKKILGPRDSHATSLIPSVNVAIVVVPDHEQGDMGSSPVQGKTPIFVSDERVGRTG